MLLFVRSSTRLGLIVLAEPELTLEELLDGELVIGRFVAHGVALHTSDGELLDRSGPSLALRKNVLTT